MKLLVLNRKQRILKSEQLNIWGSSIVQPNT